jgi:glutathione peroxidase
MKLTSLLILGLISLFLSSDASKSVYDFNVTDIDGNKVALSKYKGKVLIIVNVASKCGLTPQYADLQAFYDKHKSKGVEILGFPANNFMGQEPGSNAEIKKFCSSQFKVSFPMFSKISVQGSDMAPLYKYLTTKQENGVMDAPVKWNFQKFIIDKSGRWVESIKPSDKITDPSIEKRILALTKK